MWCGEKLSSKKADITNIEPTIFFYRGTEN